MNVKVSVKEVAYVFRNDFVKPYLERHKTIEKKGAIYVTRTPPA